MAQAVMINLFLFHISTAENSFLITPEPVYCHFDYPNFDDTIQPAHFYHNRFVAQLLENEVANLDSNLQIIGFKIQWNIFQYRVVFDYQNVNYSFVICFEKFTGGTLLVTTEDMTQRARGVKTTTNIYFVTKHRTIG